MTSFNRVEGRLEKFQVKQSMVCSWAGFLPNTSGKMLPLKNTPPPEELVHKLRHANQHLVIASLRAQDMQAQAEASVERQTQFLSMLAHELRNPLAPIAMAAEMLGKISTAHPMLPDIQQIIVRQVANMTRLLEDLLDAARVSSGKINLKKTILSLADIAHSAAEISQPHLVKRAQHLVLELPAQPVMLEGDAVRLSQVFSNLLINASKFSPDQAVITLSAQQRPDGMLAIAVKDQGIGIDPKIQPFIFDLFTQASSTLDRSQGGLGIGLSMVRALVEMHGGSVEVRSAGLGCGSEFIVVLPGAAEDALPQAPVAANAPPARPCRILVIEDNADTNATLSSCLMLEGHTVDSAHDGLSGLAMAKAGAYDIVACDIGLPAMSGYEVIAQLRGLGLSPEPCCIAMTGYDQHENRALAQQAGFDHYLVKPVSMNAVREIVASNFPPAFLSAP